MKYYFLTNLNAINLLNKSIELNKTTTESWSTLWNSAISENSFFWFSVATIGIAIAGLGITYIVFTEARKIVEEQDYKQLLRLMIWPLVIAILLGQNATLAANTIINIKLASDAILAKSQEIQWAGVTFQTALNEINTYSVGRTALEQVYKECIGLQDQAFYNCLQDKQSEAQEILNQLQQISNNGAVGWLQELLQDPINTLATSTFIPALRLVFYIVQWAVVNVLESLLLLHCLYAPIALGASILPVSNRPIIEWFVGLFSIYGIKLGYNLCVGFGAIIITYSKSFQFTDLAFLCYIAFFAPWVAWAYARGGGQNLVTAMQSNLQAVKDIGNAAFKAAGTLL
ncbi:hypothetical protein [Chroococcus sp. FPU101]|uniref:hypothetical protein n=1 Tax=Chroococcus sp. FPU101 TaxID=1974212 RepID=UPI001A8CBD7E|nr:hypothetical protein [Chroococcus sp. FPU101]GFE69098.1 hypothetical protein CFPU101_17080 [Chroococcus sp. FPU101]